MNKKYLVEILHGNISLIDQVNVNDADLANIDIIVYPVDVSNMLNQYLKHQIGSDDLTKWAIFICGRSEYCPLNYLDETIGDFYEDMFYVIQRLSTPEIDGPVNEVSVAAYLKELDKYNDSKPS